MTLENHLDIHGRRQFLAIIGGREARGEKRGTPQKGSHLDPLSLSAMEHIKLYYLMYFSMNFL